MNPSGIVDFHTHWGEATHRRDGLDPAAWLAPLDRHGVARAVVLPEAGLFHAGRIAEDNDRVAAVCARSGGRMIPFATVHVGERGEAIGELERCLVRLGMRGLKIHPWYQGTSISGPVMDEACELAGAHGIPVFFHDGTPAFSLPSQIALLAKRHPRTQVVLGHCGLFEHWREAVAALDACPNLWGCLCSPHVGALRELVRCCDTGRLLWGTDHGYGTADVYPYRFGLNEVIGWSDEVSEAILVRNPARLLGLISSK